MKYIAKILCFVLALATVFAVIGISTFAENDSTSTDTQAAWDGVTIDTSWYNTTDTEFVITTAPQFAGFAAIANGTADGIAADYFGGKTIKLGADIDLGNQLWAPIGGRTSSSLSGQIECVFDGQGHTISNLKVEKGADYVNYNMNIGLFGITRTGKFVAKNFTIENVDIYGSASVAAVLGRTVSCGAKIENVTVKGDIKIEASNQNVGAICAQGYTPVIIDCHVIGNDGSYIKADGKQVGGILGWSGESSNKTTVTNCSVDNVTISGTAYVGSIAAIAQYGATVTNNTAKDVTLNVVEGFENNNYYYGTVIGSANAGYIDSKGNNTAPIYISDNKVENVVVTLNGEAVESPVKYGAAYDATSYVSVRIGDAHYQNIKVALDAAGNNAELVLVDNVQLNAPITVSAGNTLVIDLAGKVMSYTSSVVGEDMITNYGTLTIKDSVGGGKITYSNTDIAGSNVTVSTITNAPGGLLTVEGGTIENTTSANNAWVGKIMPFAIDNVTNGTLGVAKTIVNGGIVKSNYRSIRLFANSTSDRNTVNINGGEFI